MRRGARVYQAQGHNPITAGRYHVCVAEIPFEITPLDVRKRVDSGEHIKLLDVREPNEFQLARIAGAELIPMRAVPAQLQHIEGFADDAP